MNNQIQPALTEDKSTPKTVSMYPDQWAVIDEIDAQFGFRNLSSALRWIINDYRRLKAQEAERLQPER
jgi:hypothetical protein